MSADTRPPGRLKMAELAERSGVSAGTVKHYLREGLLDGGEPVVRTSRNMAWYPPSYVDRVRLIKRLQEERFMPLRHIRGMLALTEGPRTGRAQVEARYALPGNVLDRLAEVGAVAPTEEGYGADDLRVLEAIQSFRSGGWDETLGFTVHDTVRYRKALEPLVREEVRVLRERLAGQVDDERAVELVRAGAEPLRELIGALHSRMLLAELDRVLGGATP